MSLSAKLKFIIAEIDSIRAQLWGNGFRPKEMTNFQLKVFKKLSRAKRSIESIGVR